MTKNEVVQRVVLNVSKSLPTPIVFCKQWDNTVRVLQAVLYDDEAEFAIESGFAARLRGTKKDGTRIYLDARSQKSNVAEFVLTQNALAAAGPAACEVELSDADGCVVKTCNFTLNVTKAALDDDAVQSTDEFQSLENVRAEVAANTKVVRDNEAAIKAVSDNLAAICLSMARWSWWATARQRSRR